MISTKLFDINMFLRKSLKNVRNVIKCKQKGLPLKLVFLCDVDIDSIPAGTKFSHPFSICINAGAKIGKHCDIRQGVTLGGREPYNTLIHEKIVIGDNVFIGCNSSILGNVKIGNNVIVGAHALVLADVPDNTTVTGVWKRHGQNK